MQQDHMARYIRKSSQLLTPIYIEDSSELEGATRQMCVDFESKGCLTVKSRCWFISGQDRDSVEDTLKDSISKNKFK